MYQPAQVNVHSPARSRSPVPHYLPAPVPIMPRPKSPLASPRQRHLEYDLAHHVPSPIHLTAAGPALPNTGLDRPSSLDITQSPTYQMVQELEVGRDHGPVGGTQYVVSNAPEVGEDEGFPAQSQSFKALMSSLLSHPRV